MCDMGLKWKSWKYDLKRNSYDPVLSIDEIVAGQTDSRVDKTQFKTLVTSWFDEKTQEESEKNKVIRSKSKEPHITGTKSFARIIHEETIKNNGVRPSRGTIYCITRTPANGRIVNDSVTEVIDKLKNISDASSGSSGSSSVAGGVPDWTTNDLAQVKGRERGGRIRCMGKVVMPKGKGSCSTQDPQVPVLKTRINELEGEVKELREKQVSMDQFMAIVKQHMPNINFSNVFNTSNKQVPNDSCSAYVKPTSSRNSQNHSSDSRSRGKR